MANIIFNVNNGAQLFLTQNKIDGKVTATTSTNTGVIRRDEIPAGDMVMLINYYRYVKENDIHCGFINPNGVNEM